MTTTAIKISNLRKDFEFSLKNDKKSFLSNLFSPDKKRVEAVKGISFEVKSGERLAFIGPNGAGKSTTIKMLTGILFPSSGEVDVLGLNPVSDRRKLAYRIGTVFGQRSQMFPNLPITDSMYFFGVMYDLSENKINERINYLCEAFYLNEFKDQPVRKLSLGQRMRGEVACALVHSPKIIFLDEPTIGLDVVAKKALRELLLKINREEGTTIFLTSHDVGDIEALCERTIVVNHGQIVKDMKTDELAKDFIHEKFIDLTVSKKLANQVSELEDVSFLDGIKKVKEVGEKITFEIDTKKISVSGALKFLLEKYDVVDVNVYDVDLETVIREMYVK